MTFALLQKFCLTQVGQEHYAILRQVIYLNDKENEDFNASEGFITTENVRVVGNGTSLTFNSAPYNTELWFENDTNLTVTMDKGDIYLIPESHAVCNISRKNTKQIHQITHKQRIAGDRRSATDPYELTNWLKSDDTNSDFVELLKSYRWQLV